MAFEKLKMKVNIFVMSATHKISLTRFVGMINSYFITHSKPIALINFLALKIMIKNDAIKALYSYFPISSLFLFVRLKDRR